MCTLLWMSLDVPPYSGMLSFVFDDVVCCFRDGDRQCGHLRLCLVAAKHAPSVPLPVS